MTPHIAILGSAVADIILEVPKLPKTQEDVHILSQSMQIGGCAYNVAQILSLYQIPHHLCTPIGTGLYGDFVREEFRKQQLTSFFPDATTPNGCCYCFVEPSGERTFLSYHGAEYQIQEEWLRTLDQESIDTLYLCGLELEESSGAHLIDYVKRHPSLTIYFAPGPRFLNIPPSRLSVLFQHHCILHINEEEALSFTKEATIPQAAMQLYQRTKQTVIITLGKDGCYFMEQGIGSYVSTQQVTPVDTIGAGDAHIGAIIANRSLGHSWQASIQAANKISAQVVSSKGATLSVDQFHEAIS